MWQSYDKILFIFKKNYEPLSKLIIKIIFTEKE